MKPDTPSNLWNDYPLDDCVKQASELIEQKGAEIHQKWTCRHCGSRQTMGEPNIFYRSGRCEECDQITVISECNYAAIFKIRR
jgi:hypothetical protein